MSVGSRALGAPRTRAERLREHRARKLQTIEPVVRGRGRGARRKSRPRRRYDLSLGEQAGIALRLPNLFLPGFWSRFLSLLLLIPTLLTIHQFLVAPDYRVSEPEVRGSELLGEAQIRSIAGIGGGTIFTVDRAEAEANLLSHPEIAQVEVEVRWPNRVVIEVVERRPLAVWNDGGRSWWLGSDGVAFIERGSWPGLVEVTSIEPVLEISEDPQRPAIDPAILRGLDRLGADLPKGAALHYDPEHGYGFEDPRGWSAYFGAYGDMDSKVVVYQAIVRHLLNEEIEAKIVSVESPSAPYYSTAR
jgi:hypothetical protein